ncbi:MAG TPA: 1-deoxy-D-xylulose-5-phosphate synthase N-terminal domain-containing protein, partial [Paracoccus sp. (in: a-proteobacteria)]|nr:1-deoxy-D-xylulose-5-phosphate synthase N-terminal domain-containing protein [Paracoccus sp. (in: a-proteobacteria)]
MDIADRRKADPAHWRLATAIRALSMDAVEAANSGHPGMPMGMADIAEVATVLFRNHLKFDAASPHWFDRDRFVLSAGHGSMLIYSLLYLTGYEQMTLDQIRNFRQWGSITAGHPEYGHAEGVETTTGPLGQGIATAVGMAIAEEAMRAQFGADLCSHKTWVIAGDGCLMEGISQEAIGLAGMQQLKNLIVLWDHNDITIDGRVSLSDKTDQLKRFEASGWRVLSCDGHDAADIDRALTDAASGKDDRPVMVACKTIIGFGAPHKQDSSGVHGSPLGANEIAAARAALGWDHPAFVIPEDILADWRAIGTRARAAREAWNARVDASANR